MSVWNPAFGPLLSAQKLQGAHRVAMLGIGGVGMYGLACLLQQRGVTVIGQDLVEGTYTRALLQRGAEIQIGPNIPEPLLETADCLIYSTALPQDHTNLKQAKLESIPCLSRSDALAGAMVGGGRQIAVSGTHGKSTATTMLSHIYREAGRDPTVLCGAEAVGEDSPLLIGRDGFVYEACEYMGSFWSFRPDVALVLGAEQDHVDCYPTEESYLAAYGRFVAGAERIAVYGGDQKAVRVCLESGREVQSYALEESSADLHGYGLERFGSGYRYGVRWRGQDLGTFFLPLAGQFNVENALGATLVALMDGISPEPIRRALAKERGVKRRLEQVGTLGGASVYEDYAHHPTEMAASLGALRTHTAGRLYCVFQSHTYTRTAAYLREIGQALCLADRAWVLPIYPARETDTLGMSHKVIAHAADSSCVTAESSADQVWAQLEQHMRPGDTAVLMGAGSIHDLFAPFIAKLGQNREYPLL